MRTALVSVPGCWTGDYTDEWLWLLLLPPEGPLPLQALLQMLCDESRRILALSERRGPPSTLSKGEPGAPLERFPKEGPGLLEVVPALRRHASLTPRTGEKVRGVAPESG